MLPILNIFNHTLKVDDKFKKIVIYFEMNFNKIFILKPPGLEN